jgi:hypothetical protein
MTVRFVVHGAHPGSNGPQGRRWISAAPFSASTTSAVPGRQAIPATRASVATPEASASAKRLLPAFGWPASSIHEQEVHEAGKLRGVVLDVGHAMDGHRQPGGSLLGRTGALRNYLEAVLTPPVPL